MTEFNHATCNHLLHAKFHIFYAKLLSTNYISLYTFLAKWQNANMYHDKTSHKFSYKFAISTHIFSFNLLILSKQIHQTGSFHVWLSGLSGLILRDQRSWCDIDVMCKTETHHPPGPTTTPKRLRSCLWMWMGMKYSVVIIIVSIHFNKTQNSHQIACPRIFLWV